MADDVNPEDRLAALNLTSEDVERYVAGYKENVNAIGQLKKTLRANMKRALAAFLFLVAMGMFAFYSERTHNDSQQETLNAHQKELEVLIEQNQDTIRSNQQAIEKTCVYLKRVKDVSVHLLSQRGEPLDPNLIQDPIVREAVRPFLEASNSRNAALVEADLLVLEQQLNCD